MTLRLLLCGALLTVASGYAAAAELEGLSDKDMRCITGGAMPNPFLCCETAGCCENTCQVHDGNR